MNDTNTLLSENELIVTPLVFSTDDTLLLIILKKYYLI